MLKKKNKQLSFLHCYHHFFVVVGSYVSAKWYPGGPITMLGIVNTLTHAIMYFYYFLTAFKPELKQSIWWKKHITQLQMVQFVYLSIHFVRAILAKNCNYPKPLLIFAFMQNFIFLIMFSNFYRRVYLKKKSD